MVSLESSIKDISNTADINSVADNVCAPHMNLINYDMMKDLTQIQDTNFVKLEQPIINNSILAGQKNIAIDASMTDNTLKSSSGFEFLYFQSKMRW